MSSTRDERVDNALQQLLERLVPPQQPPETPSHADQRWDEANELARDLLDREREPGVADDVNQAADLINRRLVREGDGRPERASRFGGLYSRLLAQPVLGQKWGILYFLWRVSEGQGVDGHEIDARASVDGAVRVGRGDGEQEDEDGDEHNGEEEEEAVFDEAFARNGLPRVPKVKGSGSPRHSPMHKSSLKLPPALPVPLIALLHSLAEPSLLYRSLSEFVESSEGGLVGQSLRSAIGQELRSYLGLVATLEGQIRRALAQLDDSLPHAGLGKAGVTLKRCVIWTREATLGLRLMSMVVESTKGKKGGELISLIHNLATSHGDAFVYTFAERLLASITRPFYNMLRAWIYDGELEDPYREFFVSENTDYEDSGATSVWENKYLLKDAMIPSIVTPDFAQRVYLIGKSLNFIRYGCHDSAWVESYSKEASRELKYGDTANLGQSIDEAYKTVMARLIWLMETKFALAEHLAALKKYLLLGQGDFIALLMESLASNLDRPANSQYRHTLTAQLEHAIRNSNAQFDSPDVLRRLDARMLELSHGEIGWDVFTLEYRVDSPLDVIVTPWASKQYLKIFNFLWRVKRVEFALATTWRRVQTGARGVLGAVSDKLGADWKSARLGLAGMVHLVDQLQYYILFEVIEASWSGLQKAIQNPASGTVTLDTLISAHTAYLRSITRKGLLGGAGGVDFTAQLHELLKLMLNYRDAVDGLYSFSVAEFTKRQEMSARIETRTRAGRWGLTEADDDDDDAASAGNAKSKGAGRPRKGESFNESVAPSLLPLGGGGADGERNVLEQLRQRLRSLEVDFKARVNVLLGDLAYQPDVDMRFLGVVMNFNNVYSPARKRRPKVESHKPPAA
ncbi:Microtubule-nucleating Tub4p (gamma-tubulin) complex component [Friedmanniomyces endolithicus]|uniref:Microtubule-nucleating Tub4p (Gamma-tubulin) complex component n=1 Tax=Rachicladosporium monterosium TaxID=1507873 RepID=A0ABR0LDA0_9PEZI|nr:Microtubule-nucleating Tub4p (gamma-tubulin) complex component [Friedmanniomyces endolithicus]KAK5147103.1 Microtubule-nucleating Tub4p (gamma-tubulin) complex component [Rachicladosporium monterosium]